MEGWLASMQTWLFAVEAGLEGAWALQASEEVLLTAWDDDCGWGRERNGGMRGVRWAPCVIGTMGLCMLCLAPAGRKGSQVRVAALPCLECCSVVETAAKLHGLSCC